MSNEPERRTLYHAAPSYYSQIARLALAEARIAYASHPVDIHRRRQNLEPWYVQINPNCTVPALVDGARTLIESRDIVAFALGAIEGEAAAWVDRQYAYPIDELTFGRLLAWNPLARTMVPRSLAKSEAQFRALAQRHRELAPAYLRRAEVFAKRLRTFDPSTAMALWHERLTQARGHLDALERALSDGRETLVATGYSAADVVYTVFLARLCFVHLRDELEKRPAVRRYAERMFARRTFREADVWTHVELRELLHLWFD